MARNPAWIKKDQSWRLITYKLEKLGQLNKNILSQPKKKRRQKQPPPKTKNIWLAFAALIMQYWGCNFFPHIFYCLQIQGGSVLPKTTPIRGLLKKRSIINGFNITLIPFQTIFLAIKWTVSTRRMQDPKRRYWILRKRMHKRCKWNRTIYRKRKSKMLHQ